MQWMRYVGLFLLSFGLLAEVPQTPNLLNPSITVFGNVLGCINPLKPGPSVFGHSHGHEISHHPEYDPCNTLLFRELELDLRAPIAPFVQGGATLAVEQSDQTHFELHLEEVYASFKGLGGVYKVGRFLVGLSRFNQTHLHDLPQLSQPYVLKAFVGDHALPANGISAQYLLPTLDDQHAFTLTLEALQGAGIGFQATKKTFFAGTGRLAWFWDLHDHNIELASSVYGEPALEAKKGKSAFLHTAEWHYQWKPLIEGQFRSFLLGGQFVWSPFQQPLETHLPLGGFMWAQYQLQKDWYIGGRYEYLQGIHEDAPVMHGLGVFATYYTSEFLRWRLGYEHIAENTANFLGHDRLSVELNFIFGSHPQEPYWVNQ